MDDAASPAPARLERPKLVQWDVQRDGHRRTEHRARLIRRRAGARRAAVSASARTRELVAHLDDEQLERVHSLDHEPARVGPRAHRGLRGPVAGPPPRQATPPAPRAGGAVRPLRDPPAIRGEIEVSPPRGASLPQQVRARTLETTAEPDGRWRRPRDGHPATSCNTARRCARRSRSPACCLRRTSHRSRSRSRMPTAPRSGFDRAGRPVEMGASRGGLRLRQRAPAPSPPDARLPDRPAVTQQCELAALQRAGRLRAAEWWSEEGWDWREEQRQTHHPSMAAGHPQAPACHVCFFEAEAYARAHRARLPSEAECGRRPPPASRCARRRRSFAEPRRAGGRRAGGGEWTGSCFGGYPGFVAHPYQERLRRSSSARTTAC